MDITEFIKATTWHGSLSEIPSMDANNIHAAAITGNAEAVRSLLKEDPSNATATAGPYNTSALVHLCLSRYLRLDDSRSDDFLAAAKALLDAGANPNEGFWHNGEFETALYGAAGVAHHEALTKLLLQYGADPNDADACYHAPESHHNGALKAMVQTGKISRENLTVMLIRKLDWHDYEGVKWLLEYGVDPNTAWGENQPIHHALKRSNDLSIIKLLIDHGADTSSAMPLAAREGRTDVLELVKPRLTGIDNAIASCAMGQQPDPAFVDEILSMGDKLLARFCLNANAAGVEQLLSIGIDVNTPYQEGDAYFGIPSGSLPIHVASWLHWPQVVNLLIEHGALINAVDNNGNTPLSLAIRACTNSYWTERRSPKIVKALIDAGASVQPIQIPTGYDEIDAYLQLMQNR